MPLSISPGIIFLAAMLKRHRSISPQGRIVFAKNLFSIYQTARITANTGEDGVYVPHRGISRWIMWARPQRLDLNISPSAIYRGPKMKTYKTAGNPGHLTSPSTTGGKYVGQMGR